MISKDTTQLYDPDCSTCAYRVERHPSKRSDPCRPRKHDFVCMVCAKAISEHGVWMSHTVQVYSDEGEWLGFRERWIQDVPCRKYDKRLKKWFLADYEPRDSS